MRKWEGSRRPSISFDITQGLVHIQVMSVILSVEKSTQGGGCKIYQLLSDGTERRFKQDYDDNSVISEVKINMDEFWSQWDASLQMIVAQKPSQGGWDQIRVHFDRTCMPIWDFVVHTKSGAKRAFGIYGRVKGGMDLEDGAGKLANEYEKIYNYMSGN